MRPLLLTLTFFLTIASSASAQNWGWNRTSVKGNGDVTTQSRDLKGFDGIRACCSLNVELTQGGSFSVEVEAESNLQEYIETEVSGNTLEIGFKDNVNIRNREPIIVRVTLPELEMIDASSSADVVTMGSFKGERLRLESSSGSAIEATFSGGRVSADASSGGRVNVEGKVDFVDAEASSGAKVLADNLDAKEADADVSSGARIEVRVSEKLKADASSGGSIHYHGNPSDLNTDTSSGGSVRNS